MCSPKEVREGLTDGCEAVSTMVDEGVFEWVCRGVGVLYSVFESM